MQCKSHAINHPSIMVIMFRFCTNSFKVVLDCIRFNLVYLINYKLSLCGYFMFVAPDTTKNIFIYGIGLLVDRCTSSVLTMRR